MLTDIQRRAVWEGWLVRAYYFADLSRPAATASDSEIDITPSSTTRHAPRHPV